MKEIDKPEKNDFPMTIQEIADKEGCTRQRVMQILDKATKKVKRRLSAKGYDKDYFFKD